MPATPTHANPTESVEIPPAIALRRIASRFWPYARPYRRWIALSLLLVIAVPAIETLKIWMFKLVIDDVLVPRDFEPFLWIGGTFVGLTIVGAAIGVFDDTLSAWIGERFVLGIRLELFRHLHLLAPTSLSRRRSGDLVARLTSDVGAIETFAVSGVTDAVAFGAEAAFFTAALFLLSWDLALVALVVAPLFWLVASRFSNLIRDASRERRRRGGTIGAVAEDSLANALLVQAYHRHDLQAERFEAENRANFTASMRSAKLQALFAPAVEGIEVLGALVVIGYGTWKLSNGALTIGGLLVFLTYLTQLYDPIRGLSRLATSLHSAAAGAERVAELLDEAPGVPVAADALRPAATRGHLVLSGVTFGYGGEPTLDDVSVAFPAGTLTAIAGENGSGKSTLVRLLLRLHDPEVGQVTLDGHDLRDLDPEWLHDQFAVLLQDALMLDMSVRDNIAFGDPAASEAAVLAAARAAGVNGFIRNLAHGYDTRVGPRGSALSGGQRQRVAMARAILRNAPIVILDEPTNHLDAEGRADMLATIRRLSADRTTILISHDPDVLALADTIVELRDGRLIDATVRIAA